MANVIKWLNNEGVDEDEEFQIICGYVDDTVYDSSDD